MLRGSHEPMHIGHFGQCRTHGKGSINIKGSDEELQGDCSSTGDGKRPLGPYHPAHSPRSAAADSMHGHSHLLEDVLLPHQLLPFPVGLGDHDVQDVLPIVGDIANKEHQILQQLDDKPSQKDMRDDKCEMQTLGKLPGPTHSCSLPHLHGEPALPQTRLSKAQSLSLAFNFSPQLHPDLLSKHTPHSTHSEVPPRLRISGTPI